MTLKLTYAGFNYPDFYNQGYENSDSLPVLQATGSNSVALEEEYGIDTQTGAIVSDPNYTDSISDLSATITEAEADGQQVIVRPLIDFLDPSIDGGMTGDFRGYFYPTTPTQVNNFFSSYQTILVQQATAAQAAGASVFCIGTEIDQLTGPQFETQWDTIISAVRAVFSGKLTYSADWNDSQSPWQYGGAPVGTGNIETQVSFWNKLDYVGIDEYAPLSDAANPTEAQLVAGWEDAPTDANVAALTGGESLIQYYEGLSTAIGKPLFFTELGYEDATDAASSPFGSSTNVADQSLQTELYQAFETAWQADGNTSLVGVNFWDWDPYPAETATDDGPNFSPQSNAPALAVVDNIFATSLACYCSGTLIATPSGEVAVEELAIGDRVLTVSGAARQVAWIGRRSYDARFAAANPGVQPVLIRAGALGAGLPRRDLRVSPKHALYLDAVLIPAGHLLNGTTILRAPAHEPVEYLHVELDSHDVIFAEGVPAETFVDDGGRGVFQNAAEFAALHPGAPSHPVTYFAPRVEGGHALEAVRRRLNRARAA